MGMEESSLRASSLAGLQGGAGGGPGGWPLLDLSIVFRLFCEQ